MVRRPITQGRGLQAVTAPCTPPPRPRPRPRLAPSSSLGCCGNHQLWSLWQVSLQLETQDRAFVSPGLRKAQTRAGGGNLGQEVERQRTRASTGCPAGGRPHPHPTLPPPAWSTAGPRLGRPFLTRSSWVVRRHSWHFLPQSNFLGFEAAQREAGPVGAVLSTHVTLTKGTTVSPTRQFSVES